MKRVLILHISQLGGHKKASENLVEALLYRDPSLEILNIDGLGYLSSTMERMVNFFYTLTIKYFPYLWGAIYDKKTIVKFSSPFKKIIAKIAFKKISRLISSFDPQVIVSTQAFPSLLIADYKRICGKKIPLVAVLTDYFPHRFWVHPQVDAYVVASYEAKEILMREGVEEEKIHILGIPISLNFMHTFPKSEICKELGFDLNIRGVMLMGGGLGIGPIAKIARLLDEIEEEFQIIVVCGKNKKLFNWFRKEKGSFKKKISFFPYIDFVYKLMDFSDIIITKGGGLTVSEALAKGMATILIRPIPGQEERNAYYLSYKGALIKVDDVEEVAFWVRDLLRDSKKLSLLKNRAREFAFIDSSLRISDLILSYF